jgi:hypothetical protein
MTYRLKMWENPRLGGAGCQIDVPSGLEAAISEREALMA